MDLLKNKIAVITGGNSGIGFASAQEFIRHGATVVITGRRQNAVDEAVKKLGGNTVGIVSDATNLQDVFTLSKKIESFHSKIDILFANAGVSLAAPMLAVDESHFDTLFNTNVKGVYFTIQQLLSIMNDHGSIILNSSATVHRGFSGFSVYAAAKATLASLAKSISTELMDRSIRVNVVSPGPVETQLYDKMGFPLEQAKDAYADTVPMKRFGTPEEIAAIVRFLASRESSFIIGEEIIAGGGVGTL